MIQNNIVTVNKQVLRNTGMPSEMKTIRCLLGKMINFRVKLMCCIFLYIIFLRETLKLWMYVCMYICVCLCIYVCFYVYVCVCVYVYVCMYICACLYTYVCLHVWCKLNHNRKHILCVNYTMVIMYGAWLLYLVQFVLSMLYTVLAGVSVALIKLHDQNQFAEKTVYFILQLGAHHAGKSGQELGGRNWCRGHSYLLACFSWLVQPAFVQHPGKAAQGWRRHNELSPLMSIINEENAP